jgi:hypothetical protein
MIIDGRWKSFLNIHHKSLLNSMIFLASQAMGIKSWAKPFFISYTKNVVYPLLSFWGVHFKDSCVFIGVTLRRRATMVQML